MKLFYMEKAAAPRAIKNFRNILKTEGFPTDSEISTLEKYVSATGRERGVGELGRGYNQYADLVAHPRFGVSVRKIPQLAEKDVVVAKHRAGHDITHNQIKMRENTDHIGAWEKLKDISGGKGKITHIKGVDRGAAYYGYKRGYSSARGVGVVPARLDSETASYFNILRKHYPGMTTVEQHNLVGDAVVDFSHAPSASKSTMGAAADAAFSRRAYFGKQSH